jgi:beta-lactamase class A
MILQILVTGRKINFIGLFLLYILFTGNFTWAQAAFPLDKPDSKLQLKLQALTKDFKGDVGIYVRHLKTGKTAAINADTLFPTASMVKVPIMVGLFNKMKKGELDYHTELVYRDSLLYPGEDILGSFADSSKIALSKVVMLMITTSDNTASLWCQYLAGTGKRY